MQRNLARLRAGSPQKHKWQRGVGAANSDAKVKCEIGYVRNRVNIKKGAIGCLLWAGFCLD